MTRLEAEPQEGSTEYKLHLLLRPRRTLSMASTAKASGSQQSRAYLSKTGSRSTSLTSSLLIQPPTTLSRQTRLQQLTTQLLWRLQQSSPFHSCSTASLVLPSLPEATPKLGTQSKPATLLPGLEESQGALYEMGVSDDGTFVGLTEDELDESLTNLKAMAASLGCVVDVLRKVIVGHCEWSDLGQSLDGSPAKVNVDDLWVAEALVRPDLGRSTQPSPAASSLDMAPSIPNETLNGLEISQPEISRSKVMQLRVSLIGATTSGKSSLLGTLTTSKLDNGRGKSRLNLLKHRHEIVSGVTSSVAQELIGYHEGSYDEVKRRFDFLPKVINYASENVSSWNDIHTSATRLIFLSDSPGLLRYSKSAIRTLVSWQPHWTIICIAADCGDGNSSGNAAAPMSPETSIIVVPNSPSSSSSSDSLMVHVELCLKLDLPIIVAVTKMDTASKVNLRQTLSKLLSTLKAAGKKPVLMSAFDWHGHSLSDQGVDLQRISPADAAEAERVMKDVGQVGDTVVPIVLTSAMTGQGIGKLHGLLESIPILPRAGETSTATPSSKPSQDRVDLPSDVFQVDEVFAMPPSKVYSASRNLAESEQGTVLCGYMSWGSICLGDKLALGPFVVETSDQHTSQNQSLHRSTSFPSSLIYGPPMSHIYSKSIPVARTSPVSKTRPIAISATWQTVRVVSIRNLRLPTRSLLAGQVGTIGVEPIKTLVSQSCDLRRVRKGMILAATKDSEPTAYHTFVASFPASDFKAPDSPPLILGGHATIYVNSIRAAVRVTSVTLAGNESDTESHNPGDCGVFAFDGDERDGEEGPDIRINFKFLSTLEWMRIGDRVLVVPNAAAAGPITGGSVAATGGLKGFAGKICDLSG